MRYQFVAWFLDPKIHERLLQEPDKSTLEQLLLVATTWDGSMKEAPALNEQGANRIGAVSSHGRRSSLKTDASSVKCYACDKKGHYHSSPECPAKNTNCSKCGKRGHFAKCCTSTRYCNAPRNRGKRRTFSTGAGTGDMTTIAMVARTDNGTGEFKNVC